MGAVAKLAVCGLTLIAFGLVLLAAAGRRRPPATAGPDWRPAGARESMREAVNVLNAANDEAARRGWPTRWDDSTRVLPLAEAGRSTPRPPRAARGHLINHVVADEVYDRPAEPDRPFVRGVVRSNLLPGERP